MNKEALLKERSYLVNDLDLMKNSLSLYVRRNGYINFSNITSSTFCKNAIINAIEVRISEIDKTLGI